MIAGTGTSRMSCTLSTMSLRRVGDVPENLDPELPKEELIEDADVMDPAYILSLSYRNENKDRSEHDNENRL